jgi:hypothetical protein
VLTFMLVAGGLVAALIVWMIVRAVRLTAATTKLLAGRMEPVIAALRDGRTPPPDDVHALAADATTRSTLRRVLRDMGRGELFPQRYAGPEALAESDLVVWLMHGNELGAAPDAIELATAIDRDGAGRFFVFRFRTEPPHWASSKGWMAGVAGPYAAGEEAFDTPAAGVFSRFEPFDSRSPEEHVAALAPARA